MTSTVLVIESVMAGVVIGRGGCRIKSIQRDSGATVTLSDGDTANTRKVTIGGDVESRLLAAEMVEKIVGKPLLSTETTTVAAAAVAEPPKRRTIGTRRRPRDPSPPQPEVYHVSDVCWDEIARENEARERERTESLVPIVKDFYREHAEVKAMSLEDVESFRFGSNDVMVSYVDGGADDSRPIPKPVLTFRHAFQPYPRVLEVIKKQGFSEPSPVQSQTWPIILSGHDLIAIAQTGTGKTLAYILPSIVHLLGQPTPRENRIGPSVLVLGPTRELVLQIEKEIGKYVFDGIRVTSIYGGVPFADQMHRVVGEKPEIVVATPGRLNEMISVKAVNLEHVSYLVLDEADRMLDMGFKNQIEWSLRDVRPDRQTILVSATWPVGVQKLARYFATDPLNVTVGSLDLAAVETVEQNVIMLKEHEKEAWLEDYLKNMSRNVKMIIFLRTKMRVNNLFKKMTSQNINCRCIHGDRIQLEREASLADLRNGVVSILIATDVASRGLDIIDLNLVINYDFPIDIEEYVHRVGRTGRAGKKGSAITLFSYKDKSHASALIDILKKTNQRIPIDLLKLDIR